MCDKVKMYIIKKELETDKKDKSCAKLKRLLDNALQIGNIERIVELMAYEIVLQDIDYYRLFKYVCKKGYIEVVRILLNDQKTTSRICAIGLLEAGINDNKNIVTEILWHRRVHQELNISYKIGETLASDCILTIMLIRELDLVLDVKEMVIKKLIV